jgi:hypothetical protein
VGVEQLGLLAIDRELFTHVTLQLGGRHQVLVAVCEKTPAEFGKRACVLTICFAILQRVCLIVCAVRAFFHRRDAECAEQQSHTRKAPFKLNVY